MKNYNEAISNSILNHTSNLHLPIAKLYAFRATVKLHQSTTDAKKATAYTLSAMNHEPWCVIEHKTSHLRSQRPCDHAQVASLLLSTYSLLFLRRQARQVRSDNQGLPKCYGVARLDGVGVLRAGTPEDLTVVSLARDLAEARAEAVFARHDEAAGAAGQAVALAALLQPAGRQVLPECICLINGVQAVEYDVPVDLFTRVDD